MVGHPNLGRVRPEEDDVERVAAALVRGEVVIVPTDTVYGLAALPTVPGAVARLFELKRRPAGVPLAVLCDSAEQALALAAPVTDDVARLTERLWPGPLTLVLRRRDGLDLDLGGASETIGLRCPDHRLVRDIARRVGPIATTSANRHGEPTPDTAAELVAAFGEVSVVVDGGPSAAPASTVLDCTGPEWRVLREGALDLATIEAAARS
jgi:tRNA threonylcarbamoyl adenosine modification protein (Sua5/YciO/YrdC/YwlC family)